MVFMLSSSSRLPLRTLLFVCPICKHGAHEKCHRRFYQDHRLIKLLGGDEESGSGDKGHVARMTGYPCPTGCGHVCFPGQNTVDEWLTSMLSCTTNLPIIFWMFLCLTASTTLRIDETMCPGLLVTNTFVSRCERVQSNNHDQTSAQCTIQPRTGICPPLLLLLCMPFVYIRQSRNHYCVFFPGNGVKANVCYDINFLAFLPKSNGPGNHMHQKSICVVCITPTIHFF